MKQITNMEVLKNVKIGEYFTLKNGVKYLRIKPISMLTLDMSDTVQALNMETFEVQILTTESKTKELYK